jgi:hypothetical protein
MNIRMRLDRWFSVKMISLFVIPAIALAASDNGTLTVGKTVVPIDGTLWLCYSGYRGGAGSYSPTGLTGGKTVVNLFDYNVIGTSVCTTMSAIYTHNSTFRVSGFSIDPGQAWLTSATCNGIAKTGVSASSFSYSSGTATWTWSSDFNFISISSGTNVSCTISHS